MQAKEVMADEGVDDCWLYACCTYIRTATPQKKSTVIDEGLL